MSLLCYIHCTTQKGHFEHSWLFLYIHTNKVHSTKNHKQDFYTQLQDDNVLLNKICVLLCYFANLKHQALLKKACIIIVFFFFTWLYCGWRSEISWLGYNKKIHNTIVMGWCINYVHYSTGLMKCGHRVGHAVWFFFRLDGKRETIVGSLYDHLYKIVKTRSKN